MSLFYQTVISIISKPSEKRQDEEIHMILAWFINLFKKKASTFGEVNSEVIKDIIKNCSFETKKSEEIIMRQGDVGDCFYINLRGKVSIYINHKKYDENDNVDDTEVCSNEEPVIDTNIHTNYLDTARNKRIREKLGNYVTSLGPGEGFGEIALVSDDTRSASIITDETTDLMVVNKVLYARCLQAPTQRKLNEKQNFINNSPFFGNWAPKMKKLLSLCLERDIFPYDSYLTKQGDTADKIFFIIKGSAKITVNPHNHPVQYPRLYPLKLPENAEAEMISSWIDEKNAILSQNGQTKSLATNKILNPKLVRSQSKNSQVIKRRNETFAEAEQRMKIKNIEIGILGPNEIIGMSEILFDYSTYMQSVKCLEDCDVYFIFKRSYERLIAKRNPGCINKMKENVYAKLVDRNNRLKTTQPIELYRSLQYKIELSKKRKSCIQIATELKQTVTVDATKALLIQRGPLIQLDVRSKTAAYERIKKQHSIRAANKKTSTQNDEIKTVEFIGEITHSELAAVDHASKSSHTEDFNNYDDSKQDQMSSNSKLTEAENSNEQALEDLEQRIKRWHMDFGCKKVNVTKLNRIDIEKIKTDVKVGGNIFIRKHQILNDPKNRSNKSNRSTCSETSSDNNSSENNSSENELDLAPTLLKPSLRLLMPKLDPSRSSNTLNNQSSNNFINSFYNYIETVDSNESSDSIEQHQSNDTYRNLTHTNLIPSANDQQGCIMMAPTYLNYRSPSASNQQTHILKRRNSIAVPSLLSIDSSNGFNRMRKRSSLPSQIEENEPDLNRFEIHDLNQSSKLNSIAENTALVCCNTNDNSTVSVTTENLENINDDSLRKKSAAINLLYPIRRNSTQIVSTLGPYTVKRKFSMGQVKIQHTGKQFSKEEYEVLKDELKKQSRRYSINS